MSYSAFEASAGDAMDMVESYCKQYTTSNAFTSSTQPTLTEVETFLTMRYYKLQMVLGAADYELVPTDTEAVGVLQHLNAVGAALDIELTNPITGTGEPNERFKVFESMWKEGLKMLSGSGLDALGASRTSIAPDAGGISIDRKDTLREDTDAVQPVFTRRMKKHPGLTDDEEWRDS